MTMSSLTLFKVVLSLCVSIPFVGSLPASNVAGMAGLTDSVSVQLEGVNYVNKGLVGFGLIPSDFKESTGDTLGGIGSAIDIKRGTWSQGQDGTFSGTFVVQPDRGFNIDGTVDYQARLHEIDFTLTPYYDSNNLSFTDAQKTLQLKYKKTTLRFERQNKKTTGLDPLAVRNAQPGFSLLATLDPQMPIASASEPRLSIDAEGLVSNKDGTFWISDEYGPYIYRFSADGHLLQTIQPPDAWLPRDEIGHLNFTSESGPTTGRGGNQGLEGLTLDHQNQILYAMLQSAAIQDGGSSKSTARYTRLVAYNVALPIIRPILVGEWVVPLPLSDKGNALGCSEIHYLRKGLFLALSRDGDGQGGGDNNSKYRQADLFSVNAATNIARSKFDNPNNPIATGGILDPSIKPAEYVSFINYIDPKQIARFSLRNNDPADETLLDAKWESLALAPVGDHNNPDDYFLFTAADNDFLSRHGVSLGVPFDAGLDADNQFLVFRLTLPGVSKASQGF